VFDVFDFVFQIHKSSRFEIIWEFAGNKEAPFFETRFACMEYARDRLFSTFYS